MVHLARKAYEAWQQAEASARLAEAELAAAWKKFNARTGPAPDESLMSEVSRRRKVANERLLEAMASMAEARRAPFLVTSAQGGIDDTQPPRNG